MKASKKRTSLFPDVSKITLPFSCKDEFIVDKNDLLKYHLLIDKLFQKRSLYSNDFIKIYPQLDHAEKKEFCLALLEHVLHLEDDDHRFHFDFYLTLSRAIANVFQFFGENDVEFFSDFFDMINTNSKEDSFPNEDQIFERLEEIFRNKTISKKLNNTLTKRYKKLEQVIENYDYVDIEYSRPFVLLSILLHKFNPIKDIQEKLNINFATSNIVQYLKYGFPLTKDDPYYTEHLDIHQLFEEELKGQHYAFWKVKEQPTYIKIFSSEKPVLKNYAMALIYRIVWGNIVKTHNSMQIEMLNLLIRKRLPYSEDELIFVLKALVYPTMGWFNQNIFFKNVEKYIVSNKVSPSMRSALEEVLIPKNIEEKVKAKVKDILKLHFSKKGDPAVDPFLLKTDDPYGKFVNNEIAKIKKEKRDNWYLLLKHANTASGGKPNKKFQTKAEELLSKIKSDDFLKTIQNWFLFLSKMEITEMNEWYSFYLESSNANIVKGLTWIFSLLKTNELDKELEQLLVRCFKKIPGTGPSSGALGNALIYSVAIRNSLDGVALLNRANSKITQRNTKALIQKYIKATAEELNISIDDLKDFSIADFGLENGIKEFAFNDYTARLSFASFGKTKLEWFKQDGKQQKTIPSFVKKDFADELKAIRNEAKLIPKTLTIQRDRLDRSYIQERTLPWEHFCKYYVDHGLISYLTKKLIWIFENKKQSIPVIWFEGNWQNVNGKKVDWMDKKTTVRLWHPLHSSTDEILTWRNFLQEKEIKQPLKQAYREVYILTDAEVNTKTYSNRMAAHILKQHQFNALAGIRGWKYSLMGCYDDGIESQVCSIEIPTHNLRAEYWINEVNAEEAYNDTGIWNYVATDQVRFLQNEETLDLIEIPKIVFSEIMRDVDLFVGVASVGNDPAWQDNSGLPQFNNYWESYSFGDLTEVAKTRKGILEKLLPRLKIAKVSSIDGKFLKVKGTKRTYKIHIGSTNILMEPNDQYLCIVPARSAGKKNDQLFIPFEGDRGFSILLSKAFMLAEDDKIADETITRQIDS